MKKLNLYLTPAIYAEVAKVIINADKSRERFVPTSMNNAYIDMDGTTLHCVESKLTDDFFRSSQNKPINETQIGGSHYTKYAIQPFEYIYKNKLSWPQGECIKYVTRFEDKGGEQDLDKAIHILQMLRAARYGGKE